MFSLGPSPTFNTLTRPSLFTRDPQRLSLAFLDRQQSSQVIDLQRPSLAIVGHSHWKEELHPTSNVDGMPVVHSPFPAGP